MTVGHFHIPGESTRRDYAVYLLVARHRDDGQVHVYVGKTGDNREGCNPVVSRAGNHFSFNKIHSQMRNHLPREPHKYDFDYFYSTFGEYIDPKETRERIDIINEMERQLNKLAQRHFPNLVMNPYSGNYVSRSNREKRAVLATNERVGQLMEVVETVKEHVQRVT